MFLIVITEIQAIEAANWLREAGFPQYAQMYEGLYEICFFILFFYFITFIIDPNPQRLHKFGMCIQQYKSKSDYDLVFFFFFFIFYYHYGTTVQSYNLVVRLS